MTDTTFDPRRTQRLVILQHAGLLTPKHGKTGISLLRYRGDEVVAVIDREAAARLGVTVAKMGRVRCRAGRNWVSFAAAPCSKNCMNSAYM